MSALFKKKKGAMTVFMAPLIIIFSMIIVIPLIQSAAMGFFDWDGVNEATFIGFDNYRKLFNSRNLPISIRNSIQTTGAGDHFNAGFCMGILEELELKDCLVLGQAMASYYVETGETATREMLSRYMEEYSFTAESGGVV